MTFAGGALQPRPADFQHPLGYLRRDFPHATVAKRALWFMACAASRYILRYYLIRYIFRYNEFYKENEKCMV